MQGVAAHIYLVRWPDLSASLVRAESEEHLVEILDQVGNPDGCEWSIYEGPLFIDVELPAKWRLRDTRPGRPVTPDQVVVEDVGPMALEPVEAAIVLSFAEGDDGDDMRTAILEQAFPGLQAAIERQLASEWEGDEAGVLPEPELRRALHGELVRLLKVSWRREQLRTKTDPISSLARTLDLPVDLARRLADRGRGGPGGDPQGNDDPE